MTEKEKRFADEWLSDCNGARAYMAAYPHIKNEHSARTLASRLLTKVDIKKYIDRRLDEMRSEKIADITEVMQFLTSIMRGATIKRVAFSDGETYVIDVVPEVKERLRAAELIGRRLGLFDNKDKTENDNSSGVVILAKVKEV